MTYVYDKISGIPPERENRKATEEGGDIGFHNRNLYDYTGDIYDNLVDEATGEVIDNATDDGMEQLVIRSLKGRDEDMLGEIQDSRADKEADEWMKANGFDWKE